MKRIIFLFTLLLSFGVMLPAHAADITRPVISLTSPVSTTAGVATNFSATVSDSESGIASCFLYVNNEDVGPMNVDGNIASKFYTFAQAGVHTMFVFCRDNENNFQSGENASVVVTAGAGDTVPPTVSTITPTTAAVSSPTAFSVNVSDSGSGIGSCTLIVNGFSQSAMTISNGIATGVHTFTTTGAATVYAQCSDNAGNSTAGAGASVLILNSTGGGSSGSGSGSSGTPDTGETPGTTAPTPANPNPRLIKLACVPNSQPNNPCRAVYYHGLDNKRHAFPNAKVYGSWYENFSDVQEISVDVMANISLGAAVTYRPGTYLVKFTTDNKVYAVAKGGRLRWITTEELARTYYGVDWNKNIDDISDAFLTYYKFGVDIKLQADYSPTGEIAGTTTIDENISF